MSGIPIYVLGVPFLANHSQPAFRGWGALSSLVLCWFVGPQLFPSPYKAKHLFSKTLPHFPSMFSCPGQHNRWPCQSVCDRVSESLLISMKDNERWWKTMKDNERQWKAMTDNAYLIIVIFLHWHNFWRIKFTPKKPIFRVKSVKKRHFFT